LFVASCGGFRVLDGFWVFGSRVVAGVLFFGVILVIWSDIRNEFLNR
jgi:hypothetical protein